MADVIDIEAFKAKQQAERAAIAARAGIDCDCIGKDDDGRDMFAFLVDFQFADSVWSCTIWAYDLADAEARCAALRASAVVLGQLASVVPE